MVDPSEVPVFVLCGGLGTRLRELTEVIPKPMVPVGNHPILWHILRLYAHHGFRRFVLCLGYKAEVVKSYFLNYSSLNSDFTVDLGSNAVTVHSVDHGLEWQVTLAYTGELAMTGSRVAQSVAKYLGDAEHFAVTYGDGLCDADLAEELRFHLAHGKIGTVLGANLPSRFGEFKLDGTQVEQFNEKPALEDSWINGGFFLFRKAFANYLTKDEACVLEKAPLVKLAEEQELHVFRHPGFWACMDTQRDSDDLNGLWDQGDAPWAV